MLKKLFKDLTKEKKEFMNYPEFSKWMGNCIHFQDGLYFRHDSCINTEFEHARRPGFLKQILATNDIYTQFVKKIEDQWKTLKEAYRDLSFLKHGWITEAEISYYLKHWGLEVSSEQ